MSTSSQAPFTAIRPSFVSGQDPGVLASVAVPRPRKSPVPPAELQGFLAKCEPVDRSKRTEAVAYLQARFGSLDALRSEVWIAPEELAGLAAWGRALVRTHPIIVPLYDTTGKAVSVQGRLPRPTKNGERKTLNPAGYGL